MSLRKSELNTLKSTLEQQMSQRGECQARESQLQMEMNVQKQSYEEQLRKLTARVTSLTTQYQTMQDEHKSLQVGSKRK